MISTISGSGGSSSATSAQDQMQKVKEDVLAAVASELGESESDLQSAMKSGQSLSQIAASKGVSSDQLQSTIEGVVKKDMPNASDTQIANVTGRMMNGMHGHHGGHHHAAAVDTTDTTDTTDTSSTDPFASSSTSVHVVA